MDDKLYRLFLDYCPGGRYGGLMGPDVLLKRLENKLREAGHNVRLDSSLALQRLDDSAAAAAIALLPTCGQISAPSDTDIAALIRRNAA